MDDDGDVGVDNDFGKGSSLSNSTFFFDGIYGDGGDGMMLQRGSSSSNVVFSFDGIEEGDDGEVVGEGVVKSVGSPLGAVFGVADGP